MIFIPGNVPSLKNSKQMCMVKGRTLLIASKTVKKYLQRLGIQKYNSKGVTGYKTRLNLFEKAVGGYFRNVPAPCLLGFHFVRDSRRKFDYINAMQIICDLLVAHGYIVDDDCDHLIPVCFEMHGKWYTIDKGKPGVYLKLMKRA